MTPPPVPKADGRTKNGKGTYAPKAERDRRASTALTMRNAGSTYTAIAEQLGISEQQAKNDVSRAIREWVRIPAEQMVTRQRAIICDFIKTNYPIAMNRNAPDHYEAQAKILDCLAHEAKLFGLNRPVQVDLGISEEEFGRQAAALLRVTGRAPLLELVKSSQVESIDGEVIDAVEDTEGQDGAPEQERWSNL